MAGLVPAIHVLKSTSKNVDARGMTAEGFAIYL
jgi:hypothetical protein